MNEKDQLMALEKLLKEQKMAAALELANRLLKEFPESFQIRFAHAKALRATGQLEQAETALEKLYGDHRGHLNLLLEMAHLSRDLKKHSQARDYYSQALFIDPFNNQAKTALAELDKIKEKSDQTSPGSEAASFRQAYEQEKRKWQTDTLPEEEIGKILDEGRWGDDGEQDEPITHDSIRVEDEIESLKPSIPGVDEAYVPLEAVRVESRKTAADPALEQSLMPDPDFLGKETEEDDERVTTDDLADSLTGREEDRKPTVASTRRPPEPEPAETGPIEAGAVLEGDEFVTESAARLYLSQGLYEEALYIFEKLNRRQPREQYARQIEELKSKCHCQKKIQALSLFLKIIQERGG